MPERQESFWTTLPGILTGVAALITALVGVASLFIGLDDTDGPAPTGDTPSTAPTVGAGASSSGEGPSGSSTVVMARGDRLDVDTGMVGNNVRDAEVSYYFGNGYLYLNGARSAIIDAWTDQAGCAQALETRSDDYLSPDRYGDSAVCILTDDETMAQIRPSQPDASDRITVDLVNWALRGCW